MMAQVSPRGPDPAPNLGHTLIPEPIVSLILHDTTASDSQLAVYSKVCKTWRKFAVDVVVHHAMKEILSVIIHSRTVDGGEGGEKISTPVQDLLLIEMAKSMVLHRIQNNKKGGSDNKNNNKGNFCLAWFDPSGIQTTNILVEEEYEGMMTDRSVVCCREWRGYRTPMDVLRPFGYDDEFVSVSY